MTTLERRRVGAARRRRALPARAGRADQRAPAAPARHPRDRARPGRRDPRRRHDRRRHRRRHPAARRPDRFAARRSARSVPPGGARVGDRKTAAKVAVLASAPAGLRARITSVSLGRFGLQARLRNGLVLRFGDGQRLRAKWIAAQRVMSDPGAAGATYIDLRIPSRPAAGGLTEIAGRSPGAAHGRHRRIPRRARPLPRRRRPPAATTTTPPAADDGARGRHQTAAATRDATPRRRRQSLTSPSTWINGSREPNPHVRTRGLRWRNGSCAL